MHEFLDAKEGVKSPFLAKTQLQIVCHPESRIVYVNSLRGENRRKKQDRQCTHNVTLMGVSVSIVVVERAVGITCSECVSVASIIQHAMRLRHIVICGPFGSTIFFHIIS
jgi:hypothetical protein